MAIYLKESNHLIMPSSQFLTSCLEGLLHIDFYERFLRVINHPPLEIALSLRLECAKHGVRDHPEPGEDYSSSCSHARNKKKANQCSDHVEGRQGSLRQGLNESSFQLSLGTSDLDLAELLQASPPLVATRTFDRARKLLSLCNQSASATGTPVQKIVYYFADALQHRIDKRDEENAIYWRGRY
uniref:Uncharacterized protein n=1 Tax=Solanum lycopersicum TaxID=4081 RepID=A0A3Q7I9E0_SOLLC